MRRIGRYLGEVVFHQLLVAEKAIPLDAVPANHRAAPPIQHLSAVLQLLDREKEDGGLHLVVLEQLVEVGIVRARRIRQIDIDELVARAHPRFGRRRWHPELGEEPWAGCGAICGSSWIPGSAESGGAMVVAMECGGGAGEEGESEQR
jgi:hypothetical protein